MLSIFIAEMKLWNNNYLMLIDIMQSLILK